MSQISRQRVVFSGWVQGVGFRVTAQRTAGGFAVSGWVRNEPDGRVTLEAQGEPGEIDRFLAELRSRMDGAIHGMERAGAAVVPGEAGFVIHR